jgi:hypothetical protein
MNIIQSIWSVLKRPISSLAGSFKEDERNFPLEHDPVGEFLERKKLATNQSEDEVSDGPSAASVPSQDGNQPIIEASSEGVVSVERVEAAVQPAESQLESPIQSDSKAETPVTVLPNSEKEEVSRVEGEVSGVSSESEVVPPGLESGSQKIEAANIPAEDSPPEDEKIESVLDIFRSEELTLNTTSILSKELSDTSVYSLLEESKQIAKKIKKERPE